MKKTTLLTAVVATSLVLAACGGGGAGGQSRTPPNPAVGNNPETERPTAIDDSGSAFAMKSGARYVLDGIGSQTIGNLANYTQGADGAVTTINNNTLAGQTAVKDINGAASFALGRWSQGTVTTTAGSVVLDGTSNSAYHYVLFNNLAALPASGTYHCDAGKFTAPTYIGGTNVPASAYSGAATGSATLSFSAAGAAVSVTIDTSAGGQAGTLAGNSVLGSPTTSGIVGNYLGGGPGAGLMVGEGGEGKVLVVAPYQVVLANNATYRGIAVFGCSL
jgi:hypothetical protein